MSGLVPNGVHGFFVHEFGDLRNGCDSFGGPLIANGTNVANQRNLTADDNGDAQF